MSIRFLFLWSLLMTTTVAWMRFPSDVKQEGSPIAELASSIGRVELKKAGTFAWQPVSFGVGLHTLDSISTGPSSSAILRLNDERMVLVPEETQIKLQLQPFSLGYEIVLQSGGVSVVVPTKNSQKKKKTSYSALSLTTSTYQIDLSSMKGRLSVDTDANISMSSPGQIRVISAQKSVRLANVLSSSDSTLSLEELNEIEVEPYPAESELPAPDFDDEMKTEPETKAPSNVKELTGRSIANLPKSPDPEPSPAVTLGAETEKPATQIPTIKANRFDYWTILPLKQTLNFRIQIPLDVNPSDPSNLRLRITSNATGQAVDLLRTLEKSSITFSMSEVKQILTDDLGMLQQFNAEVGTVDSKWSKSKTQINLRSLRFDRSIAVSMDRWARSDESQTWKTTVPLSTYAVNLWLPDPGFLKELRPFVMGSLSFKIEPRDSAQEYKVGLIRNNKVFLLMSESSYALIGAEIVKDLTPDLIFKGSGSAFLGTGDNFDLARYLQTNAKAFFVKGKRVLPVDKELFSSPTFAGNLIKQVNPYFFSEPIEILHSKGSAAFP